MDYKITYHYETNEYDELSADWKRVISRHESGTWIFHPLSSVRYLTKQFVSDNTRDDQWVIDCILDAADCTTESVSVSLLTALRNAAPAALRDVDNVDSLLNQVQAKVVFLIHGLDAAVRAGNGAALARLNRLPIEHSKVSVVLLLCTDITDPAFASSFGRHAALNQNVALVPRKGAAEGKSFFESLEANWQVHLSDDQRRWVETNTDWSLRLVKEVFRQVERNPELTYDELFTLPALEYKVQALLDNFLEDQRDVMLRVVFGEPIPRELNHALKYLTTIRWLVKNDRGNLALAIPYIDWYIRSNEASEANGSAQKLSAKESAVLALLESKRGQVVSRDELADSIWGDEAAEKYSDWAIDQIIHRLRTKTAGMPGQVQIDAERGRGFTLR